MAARPTPKMGIYERTKGTRLWKRVMPGASGSRDLMARTFQSWLMFAPSNKERAIRKIPRTK